MAHRRGWKATGLIAAGGRFMAYLIAISLLAILIVASEQIWRWLAKHGWIDVRPKTVRRGVGHAMLGLQQFVEPNVEHVLAAENCEQVEEHDAVGDDEPVDADVLRTDLAAALRDNPIDPDAIRRHLTIALRAGLDWRALYLEAERAERTAHPYRAPSLPPLQRVAPRE
jgi:hypothetical protein